MRTLTMREAIVLIIALLMGSSGANAQTYPSKPITMVVPFAAGGPVDLMARTISTRLSALVGQSVIVENRPGAGGYVGGETVVRSAPDGYTLLVNVLEGVHTHVFAKGQAVTLPREIVPVALLAFAPNLYIGPVGGAKDMKEFIATAKANPKKINVSVIQGNASALEVISFLKQQGLDVLVVPYNSMAPVVTAMSRDEAHLYLATVGSAKALIDGKQVRGLGVFTTQRVAALADVPTMKELGLGYTVTDGINYSVFAPRQTPAAVLRVLNERLSAVIEAPETRDVLVRQGFVPGAMSLEEVGRKFNELASSMERVARESGVAPQ